jgi:hypothetical protein
MSDAPKAEKSGQLRQKFTPEEDQQVRDLVAVLGENNWHEVAAQLGTRSSRQCRERFRNYLSPNLRNDPWTAAEDQRLIDQIELFGPKWSSLVAFFPTRSEINLKNRWAQIAHRSKSDSAIGEKHKFIPSVAGIGSTPPKTDGGDNGGTIEWGSDGGSSSIDLFDLNGL